MHHPTFTFALLTLMLARCATAHETTPLVAEHVSAPTAAAQPSNRGLRVVSEADEGPLRLSVDARATHDGRSVVLREGSSLRSGDSIEFDVDVSRQAWVYVAYVDAQGEASILYPESGAGVLVHPGEQVRIPQRGTRIELNEDSGTENVMLVASEQPLERSDRELADAMSAVMTPTAADTSNGGHRARQRLGGLVAHIGVRGLVVRASTESSEHTAPAQIQADGSGVVVWKINFTHTP